MDNSKASTQGLALTLNELSGELHASYTRTDDDSELTLPQLQQALRDQGYASFHFFKHALTEFVTKAATAKDTLSLPVGKRYDAECKIVASADLMAAYLTLVRAQGGRALQMADILQALQLQGFVFGILREPIEAALAAGACEQVLIISGTPAQAGTPGHFKNLVQEKRERQAEAEENAVLHYNDLSHLTLVREGDPLLRRIAPVPGSDGTNIKGQRVAATELPELQFSDKSQGTVLDPDDPDLLRAAHAGQPVISRNGAIVHALLEVANLDLSTGHIEFDGTIRIKGDIKAGMRLKAGGDVIVLGMVEAAQIQAGGNMAVRGGVIGRPNPHPGAHALPPDTARIACGGTLQAAFLENACVKAGDAILVGAYARQCELLARNQIVVGKRGAKNSHLAGGTVQATVLVKALNLGTPNGLRTLVQVGSDPYLIEEIAAKEALFQRELAELEQVRKLMAYFKLHPEKGGPGVAAKLEATRKQLASTLFLLIEEKAGLVAKLELAQQARVEVTEALYEGVEIRIGKHVRHVNERVDGCCARLHHDSVVLESKDAVPAQPHA